MLAEIFILRKYSVGPIQRNKKLHKSELSAAALTPNKLMPDKDSDFNSYGTFSAWSRMSRQ